MSLKLDLKYFPKDNQGLYIVYECFSFDNFFRLLLKNEYDHEQALDFILCHCSLSALVWQERIHNQKYCKLSATDAIDPMNAACKAIFIKDMLDILHEERK